VCSSDLAHGLPAERTLIDPFDQRIAVTRPREFIALLDQEPIVSSFFLAPTAHADQRPAALEVLTMENEFELAFRIGLTGVAYGLPRSLVPDHHRACTILSGGNRAFERAVIEGMILHMNGEAPIGGVKTRTSCDGPALEHTIELQPEIVMEPTGGVLLHDEAVARALTDFGSRLRRLIEMSLALVFRELAGAERRDAPCPRRRLRRFSCDGSGCPGQATLLSRLACLP